jgi:N-methylhydantoinase A/oxoprolinase/acetone carboxylase beta subunit
MSRVIVPKNAGVLSAQGLLLADSIKDYSRSLIMPEAAVSTARLEKMFADLIHRGRKDMEAEGFSARNIQIQRFLDLRYMGQAYEITIPYQDKKTCLDSFHKAHKKLYSYYHADRAVEIVCIRAKAIGTTSKIDLPFYADSDRIPDSAFIKTQQLHFGGLKHRAAVFDRSELLAGNRISGPALIIDYESTTLLPPGFSLRVDSHLNLIIVGSEEIH